MLVDSVQAPTGDSSFNRGSHWQVHKFGGTCMATADRIRAAAELVIKESGEGKVVVVSAMGSHPSSPVKVTDLLLNMIKRAANSDAAFLLDLATLQDKHVETAKALLGQSGELTAFVSRLLDDIANLKAMLQAMSIGRCQLNCVWEGQDLHACIAHRVCREQLCLQPACPLRLSQIMWLVMESCGVRSSLHYAASSWERMSSE